MSEKFKLSLSLQFPDRRLQKQFSRKLLKSVVRAALISPTAPVEITLRFVNAEEGRALNREYRGKDYATNVLTFAYMTALSPNLAENPLSSGNRPCKGDSFRRRSACTAQPLLHPASGREERNEPLRDFHVNENNAAKVIQADIILCADVLQQEAVEQHKSIYDHTLHLIVHGVLHAQGYDHEKEKEASEMEALEVEVLAKLDVKNPYVYLT